MVNSGAITVTALLHAKYGNETFDVILDRLSQAAGRQLDVNQSVFESEQRTGHRNRAIAHLLLNFGMVHDEAEEALDVYFRQCAIRVRAGISRLWARRSRTWVGSHRTRRWCSTSRRPRDAGDHVHLRHVRLLG